MYRLIELIISSADPAALGNASGEYENQINEIVRLILEKKALIDGEALQQIFVRGFPECNVSSLEEFSEMVEEIDKMLLQNWDNKL